MVKRKSRYIMTFGKVEKLRGKSELEEKVKRTIRSTKIRY